MGQCRVGPCFFSFPCIKHPHLKVQRSAVYCSSVQFSSNWCTKPALEMSFLLYKDKLALPTVTTNTPNLQHCAVSSVQGAVSCVKCTLHMCLVYFTMFCVHFVMCSVRCAFCSMHCVLCRLHCVVCTMHCVVCTVHCVL